MTDVLVPALECPHTHFDLVFTPGHGYQGNGPDCEIKGNSSPIAGLAMESFEKKVRKAQAAERRALKAAIQ